MIELLPEEKAAQEEIAKLSYECVKKGAITFRELRFLFSFIAELTLAGISGRMIGEKLRNMVSPPIDLSVSRENTFRNPRCAQCNSQMKWEWTNYFSGGAGTWACPVCGLNTRGFRKRLREEMDDGQKL